MGCSPSYPLHKSPPWNKKHEGWGCDRNRLSASEVLGEALWSLARRLVLEQRDSRDMDSQSWPVCVFQGNRDMRLLLPGWGVQLQVEDRHAAQGQDR